MDDRIRKRLLTKVSQSSEILRFDEDPALAALCTSVGLEFELGNPTYDRLSPFFGVDPQISKEPPWKTQIISKEEKIGICIQRKDGERPLIRHPDFQYIIDRDSFDSNGNLWSIVIYPNDVVQRYRNKGFELVIVRDWVRTSCLSLDGTQVPYLFSNGWELKQNNAYAQVKMMAHHQLAFSGTHDIVDHLLQSDVRKFSLFDPLYRQTLNTYERVFNKGNRTSPRRLLISYLAGVALDDLAQPKWYGSESHRYVVERALEALEEEKPDLRSAILDLPQSFHTLVQGMRNPSLPQGSLAPYVEGFLRDTH